MFGHSVWLPSVSWRDWDAGIVSGWMMGQRSQVSSLLVSGLGFRVEDPFDLKMAHCPYPKL